MHSSEAMQLEARWLDVYFAEQKTKSGHPKPNSSTDVLLLLVGAVPASGVKCPSAPIMVQPVR